MLENLLVFSFCTAVNTILSCKPSSNTSPLSSSCQSENAEFMFLSSDYLIFDWRTGEQADGSHAYSLSHAFTHPHSCMSRCSYFQMTLYEKVDVRLASKLALSYCCCNQSHSIFRSFFSFLFHFTFCFLSIFMLSFLASQKGTFHE